MSFPFTYVGSDALCHCKLRYPVSPYFFWIFGPKPLVLGSTRKSIYQISAQSELVDKNFSNWQSFTVKYIVVPWHYSGFKSPQSVSPSILINAVRSIEQTRSNRRLAYVPLALLFARKNMDSVVCQSFGPNTCSPFWNAIHWRYAVTA